MCTDDGLDEVPVFDADKLFKGENQSTSESHSIGASPVDRKWPATRCILSQSGLRAKESQKSCLLNPYKLSVLFVGQRQTLQTQIRRQRMRRLIRVSSVCLQNVLPKFI